MLAAAQGVDVDQAKSQLPPPSDGVQEEVDQGSQVRAAAMKPDTAPAALQDSSNPSTSRIAKLEDEAEAGSSNPIKSLEQEESTTPARMQSSYADAVKSVDASTVSGHTSDTPVIQASTPIEPANPPETTSRVEFPPLGAAVQATVISEVKDGAEESEVENTPLSRITERTEISPPGTKPEDIADAKPEHASTEEQTEETVFANTPTLTESTSATTTSTPLKSGQDLPESTPSPSNGGPNLSVPFPEIPRSESARSSLTIDSNEAVSPNETDDKGEKRRKRLSSIKGFVRRISDQGGLSRSPSVKEKDESGDKKQKRMSLTRSGSGLGKL